MHLFQIPFQRWPLRLHAVMAGLVLALLGCGAAWFVKSTLTASKARNEELQALQMQVQQLQRAELQRASGNFTQKLPSAATSDEVVRDMTRHAQSLNLQISSLSITATEASPREIRKVQFNLALSGEYRSVKSWLSEMLGRYSSLGVQTLSLRGLPNDALRQEAQLVLVLFVRD
jgi:Tfp pilus assembly protein PilO